MATVEYDLNTSGGLMPQIQSLIAPPASEHPCKKKTRQRHRPSGRTVNHDACDSCNEGGDLICCDRCPATFHLQCHDPPLDEDDLPAGEWICHRCSVTAPKKPPAPEPVAAAALGPVFGPLPAPDTLPSGLNPDATGLPVQEAPAEPTGESDPVPVPCEPKPEAAVEPTAPSTPESVAPSSEELGPLQLLIRAASLMNAQQFELPNELSCPVQLPGWSKRSRPTGGRGCKRPAYELDGGLVPLPARVCFTCRRSCRWAPLIQCDYCPLLFHADCLEQPLATLPTTRWMCPNHAENLLEEKLLSSVSLTERVKLWDRFSGTLSQEAVKLEFLRKARRTAPPFRCKRACPKALRAKVPAAVRELYRHPPPLPPAVGANPTTFEPCAPRNCSAPPTPQEQEEWLASVVALQASIARHLAHRQRLHQGHALNGDATLGKEDAWPGKGDPALPGGCPPKGPPHGGTPRPHRTSPHSGKGSPKNGPLSPAMAGLSGSLQAYVDGVGEGDLGKLDERLVRILAWQRLQQLLPPPRRPNGLVRNSGPVTEVRARAVVCPVGGRGSPVPMSFRTLTMGSGADMDVCLSHFGHCNFVSSKHACIFYDEMSKHYELLNYSEHGTTVDNVLYSCDFSDKRSPLPPASAAVAALRGCLKGARGDHRMSATPQPQARRPCGCRSSGSSLIGGAGWEGTALLHHGSHLRLGCLQFVFSVTQEEPWP
uniref:PHD finger protein 12 n=1 Tax=Ixodes ricinus TaxID=34613 RepID=A0A131XTP2_IXORI